MNIDEIQLGVARLWRTLVRQIFLLLLTFAVVWRCFDLFSVLGSAAKDKTGAPANLAGSLLGLAHNQDFTNLLTTFGIGTILPILTIFLLLSILQLHETLVIYVGYWLPPRPRVFGSGLRSTDQLVELWRRSRDRTSLNMFFYELENKISEYRAANRDAGNEAGTFSRIFGTCKFYIVFTLLLPALARWRGIDAGWVGLHFNNGRAAQIVAVCVLVGVYAAYRHFTATRDQLSAAAFKVITKAISETNKSDGSPDTGDIASAEMQNGLKYRARQRWWGFNFDVFNVGGAGRALAMRALTSLENKRSREEKTRQLSASAYRDLYPIRTLLTRGLRRIVYGVYS